MPEEKAITKKAAANTPQDARATRKETPQRGASRAEGRPDRQYRSMAQYRNLVTVEGGDSEKVYRWFKDSSEDGQRIFNAINAGWDLVDATVETLQIGDHFVGASDRVGSVYTRPAGRNSPDRLFLMAMPKWAYEEFVEGPKQKLVDERERAITESKDSETHPDGQYGKTTIRHGRRDPGILD